MKKLIIVIGLPGSGKSYHLKKLRDTGVAGWICEDFHADAYRDSKRVVDSRYLAALVECLQRGIVCAVADIAFCDPTRLQEFEDEIRTRVPSVGIEYQCFKNDRTHCAENVERRARTNLESEKRLIEEFSAIYTTPRGAEILEVYRPPEK